MRTQCLVGACQSANRIQCDYDDSTIKSSCQFVSVLCDTTRVSFRVSFGYSQNDMWQVVVGGIRRTVCIESRPKQHTRTMLISNGAHFHSQCNAATEFFDMTQLANCFHITQNGIFRDGQHFRMIQQY